MPLNEPQSSEALNVCCNHIIENMSLDQIVELKLNSFLQKVSHDSDVGIFQLLTSTVEKCIIENILRKTNGTQTKTSQILGINRNTLRKKILELNVDIAKIKIPRRTAKRHQSQYTYMEDQESWPPTLL